MRKCPPGAISVDRVARTFAIDYLRCIVCSACVGVCNPKSLSMSKALSPAVTGHHVQSWHKPAPPAAAKAE
jgi:formate hydrogenlyase subunit 6/NADH:ubiquinone oxidoreductase subunit I